MKLPRIHLRLRPPAGVIALLASSWFAPMVLAFLLFSAWNAPRYPERAMTIVTVSFVLAVLIAFFAGLAAAAPARSWKVSVPLAGTMAILASAGFGLFLVIDVRIERTLTAAVVLAFTSAYIAYTRNVITGSTGFSNADFSHVSAAVHAIVVFLTFAFAMNGADYLRSPLWLTTTVVTVILFLTALETLRRGGLATRASFLLSAATLALLGAQLFIGLSFLPIAYLASSAIGAVVYAFALHATADVLAGRAGEVALRRQFAVSIFLVFILCLTARWA